MYWNGWGSHIKVTLSIHMYGPTNVSNQLMWDTKSSTLNGAHCQGEWSNISLILNDEEPLVFQKISRLTGWVEIDSPHTYNIIGSSTNIIDDHIANFLYPIKFRSLFSFFQEERAGIKSNYISGRQYPYSLDYISYQYVVITYSDY